MAAGLLGRTHEEVSTKPARELPASARPLSGPAVLWWRLLTRHSGVGRGTARRQLASHVGKMDLTDADLMVECGVIAGLAEESHVIATRNEESPRADQEILVGRAVLIPLAETVRSARKAQYPAMQRWLRSTPVQGREYAFAWGRQCTFRVLWGFLTIPRLRFRVEEYGTACPRPRRLGPQAGTGQALMAASAWTAGRVRCGADGRMAKCRLSSSAWLSCTGSA